MSYAQARISRLHSLMDAHSLDVFYVRDLSNIKWASAFDGVFDDEDAHALMVTDSEVILHTDSRYYQAASNAARDSGVVVDGSTQSHASFLTEFLSSRKTERDSFSNPVAIGIETSLALGEYRVLEKELAQCELDCVLKETSALIVGIRAVKDAQEIQRMRAAQAITDQAFSFVVDFIRPGMTEREVQLELEGYMFRHGAEGLAFSSIVAAGANGANPHAIPGDTVLEVGQALVMDFGARALGYCSDMTRTVFLGEPDAEMRKAYETLQEANKRVELFLRPGVTGVQAQDLAESVLDAAGFGGTMGHSLGHGVGIDVHEKPVLSRRYDKQLEQGNVVTVEPGIYVPGKFGMRLEDFGVITARGFDVFTQSTHDMVII